MRRRDAVRRATALLLAGLVMAGCDVADGARRYLSGWAPYWSPSSGTETYTANADLFEILSPFWYSAQHDPATIAAETSEAAMATMVAAARADGVPVLPAITDGSGARRMAAILADPGTRRVHVQAIVDLVTTRGFDGIDIDYEKLAFADGTDTWPTTRPVWIAFVRDLGAALHAEGKLLSVTVPPIWAGGTRGYTVYAWEEIGPHVDRLRTMNYDWSWSSPGPGSPIWWVHDTLDYAASVVPISKVELGVPAYGREWTTQARGTCPPEQVPGMVSHTLDGIAEFLADHPRVTPRRDEASGEMTFRYRRIVPTRPMAGPGERPASTQRDLLDEADGVDGSARPAARPIRMSQCRIVREVWYPDALSIAQRASAAVDTGAGVTMWALGYETPDVWSWWSAVGATVSGPAGTAPIGAVDTAAVTRSRLRVTGWAFDPEGDLPVTVTLTATEASTGEVVATQTILARLERPDVAADHPGAGEFHGFATRIGLGPDADGRYRVCATASGRYAGPATTAIGCRTVTVAPAAGS